MPTPQILISGLDPTGQSTLNSSQYLQMIQQSSPNTAIGVGLFLQQTTAPSTVVFPLAVLQHSIWMDDNGALYKFSAAPATWVPVSVPTDGIATADQIANGIITLIKLAPIPASNNYVLRLNSNSTGWEVVSAASIIPNGTLPIAALNTKGITNSFLYVDGTGAIAWVTFDIAGMVNAKTNNISIQVLHNNGSVDNGKILRSNGSAGNAWVNFASYITTQSIPLTALITGTAANAGQVVGVALDGSATLLTLASQVSVYRTAQANYVAVPTTNSPLVTFPHGLGVQPDDFYITLVCTTTELGYAVGAEIRLPFSNNSSVTAFMTIYADQNNVYISEYPWATYGVLCVWNRAAPGTYTAITSGNWRLKGYAVKYP